MVSGRDIWGAKPQKPGMHKQPLDSTFERKFSEIPPESQNSAKSHIPRGFCNTRTSPKPFEFLSPFRPGGGGARKSQFRSKKRGNGWKLGHFAPFPPISTHLHISAQKLVPRCPGSPTLQKPNGKSILLGRLGGPGVRESAEMAHFHDI